MTKAVAAIAALTLCLVGCGESPPNGEPVRLLTGPPGFPRDGGACFTNSANGPLIVDPKYGTAIIDEDMIAVTGTRPPPIPVAWRPGFTAWRIGSAVAVLDPRGNEVAVTGRRYQIAGGYVSAGGSSGIDWPQLPIGVFWACDTVTLKP